MVDLAGHENYSQIFPYAERANRQLMAVNMRELIGAGGQLKTWRGEDEVCQQQIDGTLVLSTDFKSLRTAIGLEDRKACLLEDRLTQLCDGRFVIDHQDRWGR